MAKCLITVIGMLIGLALSLGVLDRLMPLPPIHSDGAMVVVSQEGTPLRTYPSRTGVWRYPITLDRVTPFYLEALLTFEDQWFYWHPGVNPVALARAGWQWLTHQRIVSGGSTLTMQVARLIDPILAYQPSRSLKAKLRQIWRALQLEWYYSKDQILAMYLNHAPMGGMIEGIEMGARMWLGKSAQDLTRAEAALFTVLPQAPSRLRPDRHPQAARAARDKVLDRMVAQRVWTSSVVQSARIENIVAPPVRAHWLAPLAAQRLWQAAQIHSAQNNSVRTQFTPPHSTQNDAVIHSTLNADFQAVIERFLLDRVDHLPSHVSMAVLLMDNDSLEIKGYAGSADFLNETRAAHVDMVRAVRSPGSTLKPFLYAMALDDGLIHSESLLLDQPRSFGGYAPGNFQASFSGPVSVSQALEHSLNVPAVDLLERVEAQRFTAVLLNAGVKLRMPNHADPNLSLILGGGGSTLEELVGAYRSLARGGLAGKPRLQSTEPKKEFYLMSPGAAWIVRDILERGGHPDHPFYEKEQPGKQLAWKTGTSFGFRDAWAIGVTNSWTIGVWVGRPDGTPNPGFFGANIAAPLAHDIISALPARAIKERIRPASVQSVLTCWPYGVRLHNPSTQHCVEQRRAWVLNQTIPPSFSGYADLVHAPLHIQGIAAGSVLRPIPGQKKVTITVTAQGGAPHPWWMLDGKVLSQNSIKNSLILSFTRDGWHTLTVMDQQGSYDRVSFEISGVIR